MEAFEKKEDYFIGSMVFEKRVNVKIGPEVYLLVDGQQRITSLFLLFIMVCILNLTFNTIRANALTV
jgi:hypothetical protein